MRPEALADRYVRERDWGANTVAQAISTSLGLPGWYRIRIARALLDFNRFPGATTENGARGHLQRLAIMRAAENGDG